MTAGWRANQKAASARDSARGPDLLRKRHAAGHAKVTNIELFFDLVFVFAVTQLSHSLLTDLTLSGAVHTLLLFLGVWWVWIYTTWVTNWLDPDKTPVRLLLITLMLAGLVLAASIPEAFQAKGLSFAAAHVFMQVGRSAFMIWALGKENADNRRNFQRITCWLGFAGLFWLAGAFVEGQARLGIWGFALAVEYVGPSLGYATPGLGRSRSREWDVEGAHMAERCALFIIIALGESVLVTGATFADHAWTPGFVSAFVFAFLGSVATWWIYFDTGAERGSATISASADPGRTARLVYTYIHLVIVGGIIVSAVGDELVLAHPDAPAEGAIATVILGGTAIYLVGNILFKWAICGRLPLSHLAGISALALLAWPAPKLMTLVLGGATTFVLVVVAVWETISLRQRTPARSDISISIDRVAGAGDRSRER